ncbi:AraC family transcriptional regulator [Paraburkholderia kururiensis]|jgi:AraC-like DNA-binding protein|uniref:AraC family transcriptional regulator n=1 Tax=Paraburkholderia kururiensis TaxID=984307 RepID=A0ABZ0WP47_9BURK|nr:AraC family transcriptional regulator [Paraburkholderia kururiensis]WQD79169.1 AraC family transcriptional regulator [Paraburkholderia kururiensis]
MSQTLAALLKRQTDAQGPGKASPFATAVDGLILLRSDHERHPSHHIVQPALCVVAQGAKRTTFGGRHYEYGAGQALVVSVEMPALSRVVKASPSEPYLGLAIEFDPAVMRDVLACLDTPRAPAMSHGNVGHGVFVTDFEGPLADCVLRLVRLLDTPKAIPVIAPLIMREICYWLLVGPHGNEVAKVVLANSHAERVVNAIHVLRDQFSETLRIEELAAIAQMSPSAFHRQFKALTSMTPLQYQKQLRLLEARHLMANGAIHAEAAAYRVGYESPSQFSREYSRMFGAPPRRDAATLKTA